MPKSPKPKTPAAKPPATTALSYYVHDADGKGAMVQVGEQLMLAANASTARLNLEAQQRAEKPTDFKAIVTRCRYFGEENEWLQAFLPIKLSVYNFGLEFTPAPDEHGKPPADGDGDKLQEWLDSKTSIEFQEYTDPSTKQKITPELVATNREMVEQFVEDCWRELFLLDNIISMWVDDNEYGWLLPPEKCIYSDKLGVPILRFEHGLSKKEIELLPKDQQVLFTKNPVILLDSKAGQHFKVLKRSRVGEGFTKPSMNAIFRLAGEMESKQVGMNSLAFAMRKVTRWHKIGHSIDGGDRAGKPLHFYSEKRAAAIKKLWIDVVGLDDYVSNFDEEIEWPWPPKELFDDDYFASSIRRMEDWGGPLAVMLRATAQMPYLMPLLKAQASQDRYKMARFLSQTINNAFQPPIPLQTKWSNLIFNEARLAMELVKFAAISGIGSNQTIAEAVGLDPEKESALKLKEANDPNRIKKWTPIWDASHGYNPETETEMKQKAAAAKAAGQGPGSQAGRPPGSSNPT